jgi:membrane-associated phospholipid phosphatase
LTDKPFSYRTARFISTLFVPPSFTIIIFTWLALRLEYELWQRILVIGVALTFGFAFQILMFFHFKNKGMIADMDASVKEERTVPFFVAILIYAMGLLVLLLTKMDPVIISFWFCYISNTLIVIWINKYWKISAHALGASGPFGVLVYMAGTGSLLFLVVIVLIGWARIKLKMHTFAQVAAGTIAGFALTYFQIIFIVKMLKEQGWF